MLNSTYLSFFSLLFIVLLVICCFSFHSPMDSFANAIDETPSSLMKKQYDQQSVLQGKMDQYIQKQQDRLDENDNKVDHFYRMVVENVDGIVYPDEDPQNRATGYLTCPLTFQKEYTFCHLEENSFLNQPNYQCVYQKSNQIYPAPASCCQPRCTKKHLLSKVNKEQEEWIPQSEKKHYYCINKDYKCEKRLYDPFHPEKNTCGQNMLSQVPLPSFSTIEDCQKSIRCESIVSKKKCLDVAMCGWCTDENGNGKCVDGTPEGPIRGNIYYYCEPDRKDGINTYTYANPNVFDLDKSMDVSPARS